MGALRNDSQTRALYLFTESESTVQPLDRSANCTPLRGDATPTPALEMPDLDVGLVGYGRLFDADKGLVGYEVETNAVRLLRSMTIEAVLSFANGKDADGTYTIAARGAGISSAERTLWGLKIVTSSSGTVHTLQAFAQESSGGSAVIPGVTFVVPDGFFYVACVRRYTSKTSVSFDYYVNGEIIGTTTSSDGDFGNGVGGRHMVGTYYSGAVYADFFDDVIDCVRISDGVREAEDIELIHRQIFVLPGEGAELYEALLPPGESYSLDPESVARREFGVSGQALALIEEAAEYLSRNFLPDRATHDLDRWERVARINSKISESAATRRSRVLAHLRKVHGYSRDDIKEALTGILDLDTSLIQIYEFSNRFEDEFDDEEIEISWYEPDNNGAVTEPASGVLKLEFSSTDDARFYQTDQEGAPQLLLPIDAAQDMDFRVEVTASPNFSTFPEAFGIVLRDFANAHYHIFGVFGGAGDDYGHELYNGTLTSVISGVAEAAPTYWLRLKHNSDTDRWEFYTGTSENGPWTERYDVASIADPGWIGVLLRSEDSSAAAARAVEFGKVVLHEPNSLRPFRWYVVRDPAEAGTADIPSAQLVVDRMRPAHTIGTVVEATSFELAESILDREPA